MLDKIYDMWFNLENCYLTNGKRMSRLEFLKTMLNCDSDGAPQIGAILKLLENETKSYTIAQTEKYTKLLERIKLAESKILDYTDNIDNLDEFIVASAVSSFSLDSVNPFKSKTVSGKALISMGLFSSEVTPVSSTILETPDENVIPMLNKFSLVSLILQNNTKAPTMFYQKAEVIARSIYDTNGTVENVSLIDGSVFRKNGRKRELSYNGYHIKYDPKSIQHLEMPIATARGTSIKVVDYFSCKPIVYGPEVIVIL